MTHKSVGSVINQINYRKLTGILWSNMYIDREISQWLISMFTLALQDILEKLPSQKKQWVIF